MFIFILIYFILVFGILNLVLFSILLLKKQLNKSHLSLSMTYREKYEKNFIDFISTGHDISFLKGLNPFAKKTIEQLCIEYMQVVKGANKQNILKIAKALKLHEKYCKSLNSTSWWKKSQAAYYIGIFESFQCVPLLIKNLYTTNVDVYYNCAKALIRIGGKLYLKEILCAYAGISIKNNSSLLELIEEINEDISDEINSVIEFEDDRIQRFCLLCLGVKKHPIALEHIRSFIKSQKISLIESALECSHMIGAIGSQEDVDLFISCKKYSDNKKILLNLIKVLQLYRTHQCVETLSDMLILNNTEVNIASAKALLQMGKNGVLALAKAKYSLDDNQRNVASHVFESRKITQN